MKTRTAIKGFGYFLIGLAFLAAGYWWAKIKKIPIAELTLLNRQRPVWPVWKEWRHRAAVRWLQGQ